MDMVARLDVPAIAGALRHRAGAAVADAGSDGADDVEGDADDAAQRMVCGYRFVDELLAEGRDPLALGQSGCLLELNHIVLCGHSAARRAEHANHIAATRARFYGDREAGADRFYDWLDRNRSGRPLQFVARLYVRIVSSPQLFIEGNQRTATLCASHALLAAGEPPLVVDAALAAAFAPIAAACREVDRVRRTGPIRSWLAAQRLEALLEGRHGHRYMLGGNTGSPARTGAGPE